jgi:hypothetical protein
MTNPLAKKAVLATLNISRWSARRLDRQITEEVNDSHGAVADAGRYNKLLVNRAALKPIWQIANAARSLHMQMTQPWIDDGSRILPAALYLKYSEQMSKLRQQYEVEVAKFCNDYPDHVAARKQELNGMFRDEDYPSYREISSKFGFAVRVVNVPDASDFRVDLAQEHADDIRADIERHMKAALQSAMEESVRRIIDVVGNLAKRLRERDAREEKEERASALHASLIENVRELADLLPAFNLTDDPELSKITDRIVNELCVEDMEALKANPATRDSVATSAEAILAEASAWMA